MSGVPIEVVQAHNDLPVNVGNARMMLRRFIRNKLAVAGFAIVVLAFAFSFLGPLLYQTDQMHVDLASANQAPGPGHPLGADAVGFDQLGRMMVGGQTSLVIGLAAGLLATLIGAVWGSIAGYAGGWVDSAMMRLVDSGIAIPALFILLVISAITSPNSATMILVVACLSWLVPSRLVRAETLSLKNRDYVLTLRAIGGSHFRAIGRHILPNTVSTLVVNATFQVADAILLVAYVSYLGMGVQPPATDWGGMLSAGLTAVNSGSWWLIGPPGVAIILVVCAFNAIGDGLRDMFDVKGQ
ncbi:ABC transporter permease [Saxibacter everestensis]|uniref:ABC transporter permease n=1 Tax=Saxibacter everestensis TaxID=2909229 RepID=A0ABY8QTE6_9MICO|nr:ABC transporter permease [Brevibacteriaceae bacterium ZFBP1038]